MRTSHRAWSCEDLARTYGQLGEIERSFRTMKSDLGIRPIYHSKDEQIEAHLFLSILAFHIVHLIRTKLGKKQIHKSWATLKVKLNEHMRVTTVLPQNKTYCILLEQDRDLKPFQRQIFQIMGLSPGRYTQRRKTKRPQKELKKNNENQVFSNPLKNRRTGCSTKKSTAMSNLRKDRQIFYFIAQQDEVDKWEDFVPEHLLKIYFIG